MVSFFLGSEGSRFREAFFNKLEQTARTKKVFLIVPEQISLYTERELGRKFSSPISSNITTLSFTRLAHFVFKSCGGVAGAYADKVSKRIFIELTLQTLRDKLELYGNCIDRTGFGELILKTVEQAKTGGYTPDNFIELAKKLPSGELKTKTEEFAEIFSVFGGGLTAIYRDPSDDLFRAAGYLEDNFIFKDTAFFFDRFYSFHGAQTRLLGNLFSGCDCFFSICCEKDDPLFQTSQKTVRKLCLLASKFKVDVSSPKYFPIDLDKPEPIKIFERIILRNGKIEKHLPEGRIKVILASNEYSEIDEILSRIWDLVKEGYRFSDILMLTRDLESYRNPLEGALKRYRIPYFMDEKASVLSLPLFKVAESLMNAAVKPEPESFLKLLKSDCVSFSVDEIACFENYLYTWNIGTKEIRDSFSNPFSGFLLQGEETQSDIEKRQKAERVRLKLIEATDKLVATEGTAKNYAEALLNALEILEVRETLQQRISDKISTDEIAEGEELARSWKLFCEILDKLIIACGEEILSLTLFKRLYLAAAESCQMGRLPQTLDAVTIGSADRTIPTEPKIVFLFGVNDGVFPFYPDSTGLFRQSDYAELEKHGISLGASLEEKIEKERLIAYIAATAATERVYLSARLADVSGNLLNPSEIIERTLSVFGEDILAKTAGKESFLSLCKTVESARLQLAFHYKDDSTDAATLRKYFEKDTELTNRLDICADSRQNNFALKDSLMFNSLYGKRARISPSQLDTFYRCPFSYFCRYGLTVRKREKAELSALSLGTVIHSVLEVIVSRDDFMQLSDQTLKESILNFLSDFLQERLGGDFKKSARFYQKYRKLGEQITMLCLNIQNEFSVSKFRPEAFELYFGEDTEIPAIAVPFGEDGVASVIGKADRIDSYTIGNKVYLRVVDYKSGGGKNFSLSELYQGLNLQMLLYLFSLCQKPREGFEVIPAGTLYLPASGILREFCCDKNTSDIERYDKTQAGFCRNGLLLSDQQSLDAMETISPGNRGKYIPIRLKKDGSIYQKNDEFLIDRNQFEKIFSFVKKQVSQMCERLLSGDIAANPISFSGGKETVCKFCDYKDICGQADTKGKELLKMNKAEFFERIEIETTNQP